MLGYEAEEWHARHEVRDFSQVATSDAERRAARDFSIRNQYTAVATEYDAAVAATLLPQAQWLYRYLISRIFGVSIDAVQPTDDETDKRGGGDFLVTLTNQSSGALVAFTSGQDTCRIDVKENSPSRQFYWADANRPEFAIEEWTNYNDGLLGPAYDPRGTPYDAQLQIFPGIGTCYLVSMTQLRVAAMRGDFLAYPQRRTRPTRKNGYVYQSVINHVPIGDVAQYGVATREFPFDEEAIKLYNATVAVRNNSYCDV